MKSIPALFLALACLLAFGACAQSSPRSAAAISSDSHAQIPLLDHWKFLKSDPFNAAAFALDDSAWQAISLPHTWNNLDGQDGGNDYARFPCWYRTHLSFNPAWSNKTLVLRFEAANRRADLFVNGTFVGSHVGGFGAFAFDITSYLRPGDNVLAVRVTNEKDLDSPPLSADFTFFGGIYRPVSLLVLDPVHINPLNHASPGVVVRTPSITDQLATIDVATEIRNTTAQAQQAVIQTTLLDAANQEVARATTPLTSPTDQTVTSYASLKLNNPHLWNARKDPYLYHVQVALLVDGIVRDEVTQPLGLRTYSIDPQRGFILNGQPYHLHGVNRHQDRLDKGWAISNADHEEDMALIKDMGATCIRLAHYQHSDYFYQLCDKEGMVVWAELPVVNDITLSQAFTDNAKQQLRELIRQNINHPAICFWSIGNEVANQFADPTALFKQLNAVVHDEDPSRLSTLANCVIRKTPDKTYNREWWGITDTTGQNRYFGWYTRGHFTDFAPWLKEQSAQNRSFAMSEYGVGASIHYHSEDALNIDPTEEYQCSFHEAYWAAIKQSPFVWGSFVWNMFDFAVDSRKEGDHAGRNNKGLVTYDRKTKKDAYFFYQANWTDAPMLHLNSKRFTVRGLQNIQVKVYSNASAVELFVNGVSVGKASPTNCTFVWPSVPLKAGPNLVTARAAKDGRPLEDSCTWTYQPGAPTAVYVPQDDIMRDAYKNGPPPVAPPSVPSTPLSGTPTTQRAP